MDHAACYGEDLWWWYDCDNLKNPTCYWIAFIALLSSEEVFENMSDLNFKGISVVSGCQEIKYKSVVGLAGISLSIQLHLKPCERK